jgi:hypothetical protein
MRQAGSSATKALVEVSNCITQVSTQAARQSMEQDMKLVQDRQRMFDQMNQSIMSSFKRSRPFTDGRQDVA